jgi:hypothetical protein
MRQTHSGVRVEGATNGRGHNRVERQIVAGAVSKDAGGRCGLADRIWHTDLPQFKLRKSYVNFP